MQTFSNVAREFSSELALNAFSRYFSRYDIGVFSYAGMRPDIQALYEIPQRSAYLLLGQYCHSLGQSCRLRDCAIEYVDLPEAQAFAAASGRFHHVGVACSLPVLLQLVFQYLLLRTHPFSRDAPQTFPAYAFPNALNLSLGSAGRDCEIEDLLLDTLPKTRWQRIMATKFAELAILFCFCHEIAHLVRGHTDLAQQRGLMGIHELTRHNATHRPSSRCISHRLSQVWELQADRTALGFLFSYINNNRFYKRRLSKCLKCEGSDTSLKLVARLSYAISFVFFLFGQEQTSVHSSSSHPSALTRQAFAMAELSALFLHAHPECDQNAVAFVIQRAAIEAESAWHRLGFTFGGYAEDIADLPGIARLLFRRDTLSRRFLERFHWSRG